MIADRSLLDEMIDHLILLDEMIDHLIRDRSLDPVIDHGGDRSLGSVIDHGSSDRSLDP